MIITSNIIISMPVAMYYYIHFSFHVHSYSDTDTDFNVIDLSLKDGQIQMLFSQ